MSTAERFVAVYKNITNLLFYISVNYGVLQANDIPGVETIEFYQRYGFQILRRPGSEEDIPTPASCYYWKSHMDQFAPNIRVTRDDTPTEELLSGRKTIFPFSTSKKIRQLSKNNKKKLGQERKSLKTYFDRIKEFIGIVAGGVYGAWAILLYSLSENPMQEFHYDIDSDDPNTYVLWIPFEDHSTIWIIPGSHKAFVKESDLSGSQRKRLSKDYTVTDRLNGQVPIRLEVKPGDILKMHAKLIHAGDSHSKSNIRAHFYVETKVAFKGGNNLKNIYPADLFGNLTVLHYLEGITKTFNAREEWKKKRARVDDKMSKARDAKAAKKATEKRTDM